MGERREHLVKIEIRECKTESLNNTLRDIHYYRVYMNPDSPEHNYEEVLLAILNIVNKTDLYENPNALDDVDFGSGRESGQYSIFEWERILGRDVDNHFEIKDLVSHIHNHSGADHPGSIIEIKYIYRHLEKENKIKFDPVVVYGWNRDGYIVPYSLWNIDEEVYDDEVDFNDEEFIRVYYFEELKKKDRASGGFALAFNPVPSIQLENGTKVELQDSFFDFMYRSTYFKQTKDGELPLLCNICHKPLIVGDEKFPYIFTNEKFAKLPIEGDRKPDIPFEERDKKILNIKYKNICAYHSDCAHGLDK